MKLTAKAVAGLTLPAGKTDAIFFDDELKGFGYRLRLGAGGKVLRSWIVQYRRLGQGRRLLLGSTEVVSAESARDMARKALGKVANGADPQAERIDRRSKDRLTLRATVDDYLAAKQPDWRPRSFVEARRYLTTGYFKPLHGMPLDTITRHDVAARVVAIMRESGNPTAVLARGALSGFFVWAMQMGLAEANPTIGSARPVEGESRDRVLTDEELVAIWNACGTDEYGRIIRLLILTGCRRQEIGGMCWSEIDLDRGAWTLPAARSKNHRQHVLPIMPMMRAIIEQVPRMAGRDPLFGTRGAGFAGWSHGKRALDQACAVTGWRLHDIRRTVATRMADIGIAPHVIEEILNHQSGHKSGVAGVYNKSSYQREVRSALALWESHLRGLIDGERKVLPFQAPIAS